MKRLRISGAWLMLSVFSLVACVGSGCGRVQQESDGALAGSQASGANIQAKTSPEDPIEQAGQGMTAIRRASQAGRYLFVFFWRADEPQTRSMRKVFDKAMEKAADRADFVEVNTIDAAEKAIVDKFELDRAPMPLVLVLAPNGAITGGFPTKFVEQQLLEAFASPGTERCMKSLQDGKLVLLCIQNDSTKSNDAAMEGVRDFQADSRFQHATDVITLDPTDKKEVGFLGDLQVPADTAEAVTVFLAPPGKPVGKLEGATSKDALIELLSKANTTCGPGGCGPGGCGPRK
jgi:hypothetical protein